MNIQGPLTKLSFLQILKSTRSNFNFIVLLYCFFIHIFHCLSFQWFDLIWLQRLGGWGVVQLLWSPLGRWQTRQVTKGGRWSSTASRSKRFLNRNTNKALILKDQWLPFLYFTKRTVITFLALCLQYELFMSLWQRMLFRMMAFVLSAIRSNRSRLLFV